jgi:hypothetical protein
MMEMNIKDGLYELTLEAVTDPSVWKEHDEPGPYLAITIDDGQSTSLSFGLTGAQARQFAKVAAVLAGAVGI